MPVSPQFAAYLVFLDKINAVLTSEQKDRVIFALSAALDQITHAPPPPFASAAYNPFAPLRDFLTVLQLQTVLDSFRELIETMQQLQAHSPRSTANHTRRHPASRRKSSHKKHN